MYITYRLHGLYNPLIYLYITNMINNNHKYYVTMTDKFMSGWGMAEGKINKLVIECDSYDIAECVRDYALTRDEMKHINISVKKPYYNPSRYYVSLHDKTDYSNWFKYAKVMGLIQ